MYYFSVHVLKAKEKRLKSLYLPLLNYAAVISPVSSLEDSAPSEPEQTAVKHQAKSA